MKKIVLLFIQGVIVLLASSCSDKKMDTRETYLDVKINGKWSNFSEEMGAAFLSSTSLPDGALSGKNGDNEIHFQFMVTPIRFEVSPGNDTTSAKPYNKYTLHGWYYKENGKGIIECGSVNSTGIGNCGFTGIVITDDNDGYLEGYTKGASSAGSVSITDCRFRIKSNTPIPFKD